MVMATRALTRTRTGAKLSCGLAERRRRVLRPHSLAYGREAGPLHQEFVNHLPAYVRQAEVTPFELEGELGVVEA